MTKLTARRILLLFGALGAIFIAFGLATAGRDPIQRTYGEAGRELENAMDRLSDIAIGCSTEIVASAPMGGASVGCTTPQAIRVALVAFGDVRTRDRAAAFPCRPLGGPVITPRGTPWLIETYSDPDAESVRRELQQAGIALATPPACEDGITLLPADPLDETPDRWAGITFLVVGKLRARAGTRRLRPARSTWSVVRARTPWAGSV